MQLASIRDLTISYGAGPPVLHRATLDLRPGELVGLMGASGSGKSTLAMALFGALPPNAAIRSGSVDRQARMAMIWQEPNLALSPFLRVRTQIGDRNPAADPMELLGRLGFDDVKRIARSYPHQLSGGQRQRVLWAQALAADPELLIADEPTTALHESLAHDMARLARKYSCCCLWISHDREFLESIADRIVTVRQGELYC